MIQVEAVPVDRTPELGLDVPQSALPVRVLSDKGLIAQRVIDNQQLRNSPQFADDMAKVGVDDAMIARMWAKEAPLGLKNEDQFNLFKTEMDDAFKQAGLTDAEVGLKGTSTTFYSENPSKRLGHHWDADPANLGDYDINITSPTMKGRLDELGIAPSEKYGVFKTKDINNTFQPLNDFRTKWSGELGRDVNFVGYPKAVTRDSTEYILRTQGATNNKYTFSSPYSGNVMEDSFVGPVFPKTERIKIINQRLTDAPPVSTADEGMSLLHRTFDNVEDAFSSSPKVENPGLKYEGRMYAPRPDYTTRLPNGGLEAITKGNVVRISPTGDIEFFLKAKDGSIGSQVFYKKGSGQ